MAIPETPYDGIYYWNPATGQYEYAPGTAPAPSPSDADGPALWSYPGSIATDRSPSPDWIGLDRSRLPGRIDIRVPFSYSPLTPPAAVTAHDSVLSNEDIENIAQRTAELLFERLTDAAKRG